MIFAVVVSSRSFPPLCPITVYATCPLQVIIDEAMKMHWTRDPFDRLIVANAQVEKAMLITLDGDILKNCRLAVR